MPSVLAVVAVPVPILGEIRKEYGDDVKRGGGRGAGWMVFEGRRMNEQSQSRLVEPAHSNSRCLLCLMI